MTYVVSNLHGDYEKFTQLLSVIKFQDDDLMYVLGDLVDYGAQSMELIADLSVRLNVYSIAGEHDFRAAKLLTGFDKMLKNGSSPDGDYIAEMTAWVQDGGQTTLEGFRALDEEQREGVLDYLCDLALFEEAEIKGKKYLMVHAGIADYTPDSDLEDYLPEDFFGEVPDLDLPMIEGTTVIVGHQPTESGKITYGQGSIRIDCGVMNGGKLGCLCLENGEEYYV